MEFKILFTGHMIDKQEREVPRFPPDKEISARKKMLKCLKKIIKDNPSNSYIGIAGGANGGDILFHELCDELGIKTKIYIAMPVEQFKENSVVFAGKNWEERFDKLIGTRPPIINLIDEKDLINPWEQINIVMLNSALKGGPKNAAIIALWDKKKGDGRGGTYHIVNNKITEEVKKYIIDITKI
ncbi:hypothetical protein GR160_13900 [Flavobacterium sp. Sd200]|uniref:hypothetical protein n=1 Tax=Flavobacterium sp. Sd200 TaxID=2692211 RepID=UPI00136C4D17|nr:hypothetical protein [Flavobacterium sp. Sd200]MXN92317.1 hypothetical protein [Flavobacterium sp. Sd200]